MTPTLPKRFTLTRWLRAALDPVGYTAERAEADVRKFGGVSSDENLRGFVAARLFGVEFVAIVLAAPWLWFGPLLHGWIMRLMVFVGAAIIVWAAAWMFTFQITFILLREYGDGEPIVTVGMKSPRVAQRMLVATTIVTLAGALVTAVVVRHR